MSAIAPRGKTPGLHELRVDRGMLTWAEIMAGAGVVLWTAGWVIGLAAVRRAAQDWMENLGQAPTQIAIDKWHNFLRATLEGTNAYRSAQAA